METKQFKILLIVVGFLTLMTMMNTCNSCSNKREMIKLENKIDTLKNVAIKEDLTKMQKEVDKYLKIEGLKISKRTLYDWNSIVRTITRPDDRMNWYDNEIDKIEKSK